MPLLPKFLSEEETIESVRGDDGSDTHVWRRHGNLRGIENRDWLNVLKRSAQICAVAGEQTVED
jgi:hypothetical protein